MTRKTKKPENKEKPKAGYVLVCVVEPHEDKFRAKADFKGTPWQAFGPTSVEAMRALFNLMKDNGALEIK